MVAGEAVADLEREVVDTLLSGVAVTHLTDSPTAPFVRHSEERGDFLLLDFLVAETRAALVTAISVDAIAVRATGRHEVPKPKTKDTREA
jgi:hypothetical protein